MFFFDQNQWWNNTNKQTAQTTLSNHESWKENPAVHGHVPCKFIRKEEREGTENGNRENSSFCAMKCNKSQSVTHPIVDRMREDRITYYYEFTTLPDLGCDDWWIKRHYPNGEFSSYSESFYKKLKFAVCTQMPNPWLKKLHWRRYNCIVICNALTSLVGSARLYSQIVSSFELPGCICLYWTGMGQELRWVFTYVKPKPWNYQPYR